MHQDWQYINQRIKSTWAKYKQDGGPISIANKDYVNNYEHSTYVLILRRNIKQIDSGFEWINYIADIVYID